MSSFVFNKFKERYLNGEVPSADTWTFIPVSEDFKDKFEFDDVRLDHYRSISDFKDVSNARYSGTLFNYTGTELGENHLGVERLVDVSAADFQIAGESFMNGRLLTHHWTKVVDDESFSNKPMFVTNDNYDNFLQYYADTVKDNSYIQTYLDAGGFYFIRSKDELEWFGNRALSNNKIIGVIGDNFEGVIDKPIGNEEIPFEGVLDGNFYTFDITLKAQGIDNGIVGVLGKTGVVRNFRLAHSPTNALKNSIECEKPINLQHIKKDGRDINCGLLVGRNYGVVENIDAKNLDTFRLYGFVPSVYSVTNKSDDYRWNETENVVRKKFDSKNENYYFLNSFCINSPGNICPYVGYFAEGKFADDTSVLCLDANIKKDVTDPNNPVSVNTVDYGKFFETGSTALNFIANDRLNYSPLGLHTYSGNAFNFIADGETSSVDFYTKSPLYYGLDNFGYYTTRGISQWGTIGINLTSAVICYNNNLLVRDFNDEKPFTAFTPEYEMTRCSMRMHPQARAAYNIGVIIGTNYGTAQMIDVSAIVKNSTNFVGFIGGLVGKQAYGNINNVSIYMDNEFVYDFNNNYSAGDVVIYKTTPILPDVVKQKIEGSTITSSIKESILSAYCSAWYDSEQLNGENSVNTAQDVTNDCISYKLRPIFVVGGMFGRFVPMMGYDSNASQKHCSVSNATVLYKDNYMDANNNTTKRMENAFGTFIGKVDFEAQLGNLILQSNLYCTDCNLSANGSVGEPFQIYQNYIDGEGDIAPVATEIGTDTYMLTSAAIDKKLVGIYELKYNVLNTVTYNAYNQYATNAPNEQEKESYKLGIYNRADYPINLVDHNGGIIQTHILSNFMQSSITAASPNNPSLPYDTMSYTDEYNVTYPRYDHWHQYFTSPIMNTKNPPYGPAVAGYNKRNMAIQLIQMNNCFSNNYAYIQLYDDYVNNWNINKIPPSILGLTAFNNEQLYLIKKWWSYYRTNFNGCTNTATVTWDATRGGPYDAVSANFCWGLDLHNINSYVQNGTQNAFDGYTTINLNANSDLQLWYNDAGDIFKGFSFNNGAWHNIRPIDTNCLVYSTDPTTQKETVMYSTEKTYSKNILSVLNGNFNFDTSKTEMPFIPNSVSAIRSNNDTYYYYTYSSTESEENKIASNFNSLTNAFARNYPVQFNYFNTNHGFGYYTNFETSFPEKYNKNINFGVYLTPEEIREEINQSQNIDETTQQPYIETSSISADNNFGGVLVIDSSGRNVMFLDNEQQVQLTGNAVKFDTRNFEPKSGNKYKCLLEIK